MNSKRRSPNSTTTPSREPKLSRTHAPVGLSPAEWQRGLRRQFGREQAFGLENLTGEPFFSEFRIRNPASKCRCRRRRPRGNSPTRFRRSRMGCEAGMRDGPSLPGCGAATFLEKFKIDR
jgi:hypothetical protein